MEREASDIYDDERNGIIADRLHIDRYYNHNKRSFAPITRSLTNVIEDVMKSIDAYSQLPRIYPDIAIAFCKLVPS